MLALSIILIYFTSFLFASILSLTNLVCFRTENRNNISKEIIAIQLILLTTKLEMQSIFFITSEHSNKIITFAKERNKLFISLRIVIFESFFSRATKSEYSASLINFVFFKMGYKINELSRLFTIPTK